jgi:cellulose synthase/poly-beta-1,6-N-acetylglucosamine synthase-like glycosyltransferase
MNLAFELDLVRRGLVDFPENEFSSSSLDKLRPIGAKISILIEQLNENVLTKEQIVASLKSLKDELGLLANNAVPFVNVAIEDLLRFANTLEESE